MMRFRVILAVAAFALAGCNANQESCEDDAMHDRNAHK
jgi:uncharacterized protein YcfL